MLRRDELASQEEAEKARRLSHPWLFGILSFLIVAFGQPSWNWWLGPIAAAVGYALFWRILLDCPSGYKRFLWGTLWFAAVQTVQLRWFTSHPYVYIYTVYLFFVLGVGMQFGILSLFITPHHLSRLIHVIGIAALATLFEWSRLFFLSGYTWNPIGLALSGNLYSLQTGALWGIFGLSFWVILVNLLALRTWILPRSLATVSLWLIALLLPYTYGFVHLKMHAAAIEKGDHPSLQAVLVHTGLLPEAEAAQNFQDRWQVIDYVLDVWSKILRSLNKQQGKHTDLIILPEYTVMCGTYSCIFPYDYVRAIFVRELGSESIGSLPALESPLALLMKTEQGPQYFVSNAFIGQWIANHFNSGVVAGLEDVDFSPSGEKLHYSAALYFQPMSADESFNALRYEKRVLVPLGEYIPFEWCRDLAAWYGVTGSFIHGSEAKVFTTNEKPFGISICYEETFGHLMRESRQLGASFLINLTNDAWYPDSSLARQHFDHARLRSVESGIPLLRSTNLGVTGVVDSFGRILSTLGNEDSSSIWEFDSLHATIPLYTYRTLYSHVGDGLLIGFCALSATLLLLRRKKKP